ncbi:bifunctional [glutamine synthetase] adenylyltransferase/[glutamine synthetase]-adenylyl-L-tyrosine phosphorylase [Acidiphilium sp. AL]|uniref:Bifunctional [glutamine synthetase] adenylyltransferase/[glutamine synthetase]-adenylyl-L-tyrosine phosphorylase n=1 Tax=Acidiphilium iwatense TaxID=768198 RepID=A0ABS9DU42_9PROT|nr:MULTISPECIES: bifunctional [glutamine synthetase] adenylyltransferase/[glutamine synthetase]-adenylyl-L-tyrosine phosphorylase [Acidiphilium]MCF3946246.1 bifunctional [glutamine synthetase] adenylyltransferase/[glutamine synthetase]-adenylyl-L-tyrosine phosphorylase [Acidiphilium iwatense]MCU4158818.1 bifunctional [glutamine synthetase] adenylyltransferase/[glutamine synthetase]-adenylyl-L-tyrosine phosphorylase [Acidiphilium sp. AL]
MNRSIVSRDGFEADFPGPADREAAARLLESYAELGRAEARFAKSRAGRAALACLGGNAPYLAGLALREPDIVIAVQRDGPEPTFARIVAELRGIDPLASRAATARALRGAKRRAALAIALADLAGAWSVEKVTAALSELADVSISAALRHLLRVLHENGTISLPDPTDPERACRFAVLGMGKLGAGELNYSSDIDLVLLFDPSSPVYRDDAQAAMVRLARDLVPLLAERDGDGMVFRVDLRLRPDPAATPPVVSLGAALAYYESHGRTWERAALSKARPVAGDLGFGAAFLDQIRPFIWRRNLDFAAIADIHDMKRRIDQRRRNSPGAVLGRDVKLGRGGIREIEFIVQTLELVWAGHEPALRIPGTLAALRALASALHLPREVARELAESYRTLRRIEHRLQMVEDRQTHSLPETGAGFAAFAVFMGVAEPTGFAERLDQLFETVHGHFSIFFDAGTAGDGNGGVPALNVGENGAVPAAFRDHLTGLGFRDVRHLAARLRAWRGGALPALRAARARDLLDAILPSLLDSLSRQPDPDLAFRRFDQLLERQRAGIALLSLFQHNQALLGRLAAVLGAAPPLAEHLAAHAGALDALLAPVAHFTNPAPALRRLLRDAGHLEETLATLRRFVRREEFHLSVATLESRLDVDAAGTLRAELAKAALGILLPRVMADFARRYGRLRGGRFGIVALGRVGAGEMLAGSDLDLMLIYDHPPDASSARLPASQYFLRFAHALVGAITAAGAEGPIYQVDMRLRPSGNKGPVAVSLAAFRRYHAEDAWTWERLALTRARVMAATRGFAPVLDAAIRSALCRAIPAGTIRRDTASMRARLARDAPPRDDFDLKHRAGGTMELGFIAEALQLIHGPASPALFHPGTRDALAGFAGAEILTEAEAAELIAADRLFRTIQGMMRITGLAEPGPDSAPGALAPILKAAEAADFAALAARMTAAAELVRGAFLRHIGDPQRDEQGVQP